MELDGKNAVIYGGGGSIGGAMARAFAREGAAVFLVGRTAGPLEAVAADIRAAGGTAETAVFDALDERAVDEHADAVAAQAGSLDISANVITHGDVQGTPIDEMDVEDYLRPVATAVRTTFLTVRAAARHMKRQGGGVILAFGGDGDPPPGYHLGGLQTAFAALEAMRRQVSPSWLRTASASSRCERRRRGVDPGGLPRRRPDPPLARRVDAARPRAISLAEVGAIAAFVASDRARTMTAATVNVSAGSLMD